MATSAWLLLGVGAWLFAVCATCALLTAAKRADAQLAAPARAIADAATFAVVGRRVGELSGLLGLRASAIVVAVRAPRPAGPVIAIAASGTAAALLGRMLAPDDHLSARATLSGVRETRAHTTALPLQRGEQTIGAVELTIAPEHAPLNARDLQRLARAGDAISAALTTMPAGSAHDPDPPHTPGYVLYRDRRAIGRLEWRAQAHEPYGWYLARAARPARRLAVDIELDALADSPPLDRRERAQAAAALSTPLALDAAERALRGALPPALSRPHEPDVYKLRVTVTGLDPVTVALCCPSMRVTAAGEACVISGVFDSDTMRTVSRRLNLLGARVLAVFRDPGHTRGPA